MGIIIAAALQQPPFWGHPTIGDQYEPSRGGVPLGEVGNYSITPSFLKLSPGAVQRAEHINPLSGAPVWGATVELHSALQRVQILHPMRFGPKPSSSQAPKPLNWDRPPLGSTVVCWPEPEGIGHGGLQGLCLRCMELQTGAPQESGDVAAFKIPTDTHVKHPSIHQH